MIALEYEKHAHIQRDLLDWGWNDVEAFLSGCPLVLEAGAGTGMMTRRLVKRVEKVIAIDCCPSMCRQGRLVTPEASWLEQDAFNIDETTQCDAIASSSFLHWIHAPERVLQNWKRALVPDGRVAALFFLKNTAKEFYALRGGSPVSWRSLVTWRCLFENAGFKVVLAREKMCSYTLSSPRALLAFLRATGTPTTLGPAGNLSLRKLVSDYEDRYSAPAGGVLSSWQFGLVLAQKQTREASVRGGR